MTEIFTPTRAHEKPGETDDVNLAVTLTGPSQLFIQTVPIPTARSGHVVVKTAFVGLCGADAALFDGSSVYLRDGLKSYPFVFGHEWSGTVQALADDVTEFQVGQRVVGHNFITCETCAACRAGRRSRCFNHSEMGILGDYPGAASQYFLVPAKVLAGLPASLSLRHAALLEPGSTALHAVSRIGVQDDDRVVIFGTGALGLLSVQLAKALGATVHSVGVDSAGLALAKQLGADAAYNPEELVHGSYTAAIECSGAPTAVSLAAHCLTNGGRLALVGIAHHPVDAFPAAQLVIKDATIEAVLSGIDQWDRLIRLAARGVIQLEPLLDVVLPFTRAAEAFDLLMTSNRARPKILLDFTSEAA